MLMERLRWDEPADSTLDEAHVAVWEAIARLFPRRALVTQTDYGLLMVTWKIESRAGGTQFAAPILIRVEPGLLLALWTCEAEDRAAIVEDLEAVVADHLAGYDPYSRIPSCGVITLGE